MVSVKKSANLRELVVVFKWDEAPGCRDTEKVLANLEMRTDMEASVCRHRWSGRSDSDRDTAAAWNLPPY